MQFNYQNEYVSQSPLDFNYKFGLNDNSANRFNYNDISIVSSMINNLSNSNVSPLQLANTLVNASDLLIDNSTIEVSSIAMNTISFTKSLSTETLSKLNTKFDTTQFINSVLQTTFSGMSNIMSNANGGSLANKWASVKADKATGISSNVWNENSMNFEQPTKGSMANDITQLTMSSLSLINTAVSFGFNLANQKDYNKSYSDMIDRKIELLNETIEANREFMQQARDELSRRQRRFEKSNSVVNS